MFCRPKLLKTPRWRNQVTGPWMDEEFSTPTTTNLDELACNGGEAEVIKSSAVQFWEQLDVNQASVLYSCL